MPLYPYQERVKELLQSGQSVILQAPTGAGKTRAALAPFIESFFDYPPDAFPRKCIYSVPMRVLANQFLSDYDDYAASYERKYRRRISVSIQTGERSEDPELEKDLVFTTIDQTLSNFLNVPYALSGRKANVNAGAVASSYLVFDEFHLFPYKEGSGALPSTIQMLTLLQSFVPFVLMTATFSQDLLETLSEQLDAEVIVVSKEELHDIDTRWEKFSPRQRRLHLRRDSELGPRDILQLHQTRSLGVCNTVDRATDLFEGMIAHECRPIPFDASELAEHYDAIEQARDPKKRTAAIDAALVCVYELIKAQSDYQNVTWVMLLHSRFEQSHRAVKEEFARRMFGPVEDRPWELPSLILVSTQVIEVGLNLTSENLHTEIAPASSVLQRAGRCARFPGEEGDVYVYAVPAKSDGTPNHLPYSGNLCEETWKALAGWGGKRVNFEAEQDIINQAHKEHDRAMLQKIRETEGRLWQRMEDAVVANDVSARRDLIRDNIESRTILVYEPPEGVTEESPYRMQGFSLYHGTLRGKLEELWGWADELGLDWCLKYPVPRDDEQDSRAPTAYYWCSVASKDDISASLVFAVHPQLVAYDAVRGFRFVPPTSSAGGKYVTPYLRYKGGMSSGEFTYQLESYPTHIQNMTRLYEFDLRDSLAYVAKRLETHPDIQLPPNGLDCAIRLAIALHDVGKLQVEWQQWARNYQRAIDGEVPDYLVAHTLSETEEHRKIAKKVKPGRPNHAGEGAMAGLPIVGRDLEGNAGLTSTTLTAIARHHSPKLAFRNCGGFRMHEDAQRSLQQALEEAGCDPGLARHLLTERGYPLPDKYLLRTGQWMWWLVYFLIVRVVRLTDGRSQH